MHKRICDLHDKIYDLLDEIEEINTNKYENRYTDLKKEVEINKVLEKLKIPNITYVNDGKNDGGDLIWSFKFDNFPVHVDGYISNVYRLKGHQSGCFECIVDSAQTSLTTYYKFNNATTIDDIIDLDILDITEFDGYLQLIKFTKRNTRDSWDHSHAWVVEGDY